MLFDTWVGLGGFIGIYSPFQQIFGYIVTVRLIMARKSGYNELIDETSGHV